MRNILPPLLNGSLSFEEHTQSSVLKHFGWLITLRMKGPRRVRLCQRGELPSPFLSLIPIVFCSVSFSAGRQGRQAGRQHCLKVQSDPSAGLMLCSDISSSTISLLFDVGDVCRGGLSFHAVKSSMREWRQEWNFNDPHVSGSSGMNILNRITHKIQ